MLHMPARYGNKYMYARLPARRNESSYINIMVRLRFRTSISKVDPRVSTRGSTGVYVGVIKKWGFTIRKRWSTIIYLCTKCRHGGSNSLQLKHIFRIYKYIPNISLDYIFNGIMERLT